MCVGAFAGAILVPAETDAKLLVALVDATDGYSPETEKKHGDTTVTYCDVTDGNTVSSYDDEGNWAEIGDGTGNYILTIGASEFDDPDHVYFVQVAVDGCRTVRLWVHTLYEPLGQLAQVNTAGKLIPIDGNDLVQASIEDLSAGAGVGTVQQVYERIVEIVPADFNTVTVADAKIAADATANVDLDEVYARLSPIVPPDFNAVGITGNNLHVHLKAADDNAVVDVNAADVWNALIAAYSGTDGSVAEQLAAAGAAGDPWLTELPGEYGEDSAGYIIGTLLQGIVDDWLDGGRLDLLLDTAAAGGSSSGSAWKQVK